MKRAAYLTGLILALALGAMSLATMSLAQERAWVQIEAKPSLVQAEDRAKAWSTGFGNVSGYWLDSGWYGIVLGPYSPAEANAHLTELKRTGMIPPDSFVTDGRSFRDAFWTPDSRRTSSAGTLEPPATPEGDHRDGDKQAGEKQAFEESEAEARKSEGLLAPEQRRDLQTALGWFGFYTGGADGAFGRGTRAAMAAWQGANGRAATGVLTSVERDLLLQAWRAEEQSLGFETITESEAGIEITLPAALVGFDHYQPPFVHFTARAGSGLQVILISTPGDETALAGLYRDLQRLDLLPPEGARQLDGAGFRIEGRSERLQSYAQATLIRGTIKGFILSGPPEKAHLLNRIVTKMRSSFKPLGARALDPALVALDDSTRSGLISGLELRKPRLSRSGFFVDASGRVATTTEAVTQCRKITLNHDTPAHLLHADRDSGLAILAPDQALAPRGIAGLQVEPPREGAEIVTSGYSYEGRLPAPVLTFGVVTEASGLAGEDNLRRLAIPVLAGDAGGPVLGPDGAVIGLLLPRNAGQPRKLPEGVSFALSATALSQQLQAAGITPATHRAADTLPPDALAGLAADMTVLVSCWD